MASGEEPADALDTSVAHIARVYDYLLGGKDNFAADRAAADAMVAAYPDIVASMKENRAFLARAVRYLAEEVGIRQFLDIGTGIPTADNTHEVAQSGSSTDYNWWTQDRAGAGLAPGHRRGSGTADGRLGRRRPQALTGETYPALR